MWRTIVFLISLSFMGCSNEPVAWEKKPAEQQEKEFQYWNNCQIKHMKTGDFDVCFTEFEKNFGYPYKGPGSNKN